VAHKPPVYVPEREYARVDPMAYLASSLAPTFHAVDVSVLGRIHALAGFPCLWRRGLLYAHAALHAQGTRSVW
jgi:hypothetical protein